MQLGDNMIERSAAGHAVLSQNFLQHQHHLLPAHPASLDQNAHHPHVLEQRLAPSAVLAVLKRSLVCHDLLSRCFRFVFVLLLLPCHAGLRSAWCGHSQTHSRKLYRTFAVEQALFDFTLRLLVVSDTAPGRLTLPVSFLAAEGTTQILAPGITRIRDKENPAMPTPTQAATSLRVLPQNRSQQPIILQHPLSDRPFAVPVRAKLKSLRDLDCKKPRLWLRMLMQLTISPFYTIDTSVPRL